MGLGPFTDLTNAEYKKFWVNSKYNRTTPRSETWINDAAPQVRASYTPGISTTCRKIANGPLPHFLLWSPGVACVSNTTSSSPFRMNCPH